MTVRNLWLGAGGSLILHMGILAAVLNQLSPASARPEARPILVELVRSVPREAQTMRTPVPETVPSRPKAAPAAQAVPMDPVHSAKPEPRETKQPIPSKEVPGIPPVSPVTPLPREVSGNRKLFSEGPSELEQGFPGTEAGLPAAYLNDVRGRLERAKRYPWLARLRGMEGTSLVRFAIGRTGEVRDVDVVRSSAHRLLDEAAVDTVRRAAPFPALPDNLGTEAVEMDVPVVFELKPEGG